jgi:hypothetical protein
MGSVFAVLATGPSLAPEQVARVRHLRVVAVSNAYTLAPWAEALVAQDRAWWRAHPDALEFAGRKFSCMPLSAEVEEVPKCGLIRSGTNSGLLGIEVARRLGAAKVLLLGFDLHGSHFFGRHVGEKLKNTEDDKRPGGGYARMQRQFHEWAQGHKGLQVINCTPGSALRAFPMRSLDACLA